MKKQKEVALSPQMFIDRTLEEYAYCEGKLKEINAQMDKEFLAIRQKYADLLSTYQETKDEASNKLESYALENPRIFVGPKKSLAGKFGSFGFRTGKPKFKLLDGFTWTFITEFLEKNLPNYLRVTIDPAKDKLLADRYLPEVSEFFPSMGLTVVQDESFFIDLKKTIS